MAANGYIFTRTPEGEPYSKDEKYAPRELLQLIFNSTKENADGSRQLYFDTEHYISLLTSAIIIKEPSTERILNTDDSESIIRSGLYEAISNQKGKLFNYEALRASLHKKAKEFFSRPQTPYSVITSIAVTNFKKPRINTSDYTLRFGDSKQVNAMFKTIDDSNHHLSDYIGKHQSCKFTPLTIDTSGRTKSEAFHLAMQSADLIRAIWTTFSTKGSWKYNFGHPSIDPITIMPYGPAFFIYNKSKRRMSSIFWVNRSHPINPKFNQFDGKKQWPNIESIRLKAMRSINKQPYKDKLKQILVRYINALDSLDHSTSFLHLWSILEAITIPNTMQYDKLIDRASRPFNRNSRPIAKEILKLIRTERNNLTHDAELKSDATHLTYHLKRVIDHHIQSLIFNSLNVDSINEYAEILDLSTDTNILQKKRRMIQTMLKRESLHSSTKPQP
ncbi:hypothetical protein GC170_15330 [bacterium]|nr:hypothetical protein [bacterium]